MEEVQLVNLCIVRMLYEYKPYVQNLQIMSFAQLTKAAKRTSCSVKKPSKGTVGGSSSTTRKSWKRGRGGKKMEVSVLEEPKKDYLNRKRERRDEPPPPIDIPKDDFLDLFFVWVKDGVVTLPPMKKEPSHEEKRSSNFCGYHRHRSHHTMDCYTLEGQGSSHDICQRRRIIRG